MAKRALKMIMQITIHCSEPTQKQIKKENKMIRSFSKMESIICRIILDLYAVPFQIVAMHILLI